jgi:hypothetical protein
MEHPEVRRIASRQHGLVARWQLIAAGLSPDAAERALRHLRKPLPGVGLTGWGPITQQQLWRAAVLTAPNTSLSRTSAAAYWEIRRDAGRLLTVTRPGNRGRNRSGRLQVSYSRTLEGDVILVDGLAVTTTARTIIDLWPGLPHSGRSKMLREALRLRRVTVAELLAAAHRHRQRPGLTSMVTEITARMRLPFDRCRSDAEAFGLVILDEAGRPIPRVNERFAGEEADFCWPDRREIVEIDGPQWHRFKEEDARKTAIWTAAGFRVQRLGSERLFAEPASLLRIAPR